MKLLIVLGKYPTFCFSLAFSSAHNALLQHPYLLGNKLSSSN